MSSGPPNKTTFLASLDAEPVECPICTLPYSTTHQPTLTPCRHLFGATCLRTWLTLSGTPHNTCPCCRAVLFVIEPDEDGFDPWAEIDDEIEYDSDVETEVEAGIEAVVGSATRAAVEVAVRTASMSEWEALGCPVLPELNEEDLDAPSFVELYEEGLRRIFEDQDESVLEWISRFEVAERPVWEVDGEGEGGEEEGDGEGEAGEDAEKPWYEGLTLDEHFDEVNTRCPYPR